MCITEEKTGWKESNPYKWLNEDKDGFFKSATYLTEAEKAAIVESYKNRPKARGQTSEALPERRYSFSICPDQRAGMKAGCMDLSSSLKRW